MAGSKTSSFIFCWATMASYGKWGCSRTFRKILRNIASPFTKHIIGNVASTFSLVRSLARIRTPLFQVWGRDCAYNLGRSLSAKVSSIVVNHS